MLYKHLSFYLFLFIFYFNQKQNKKIPPIKFYGAKMSVFNNQKKQHILSINYFVIYLSFNKKVNILSWQNHFYYLFNIPRAPPPFFVC